LQVSVVIPALNEEGAVGGVVERVRAQGPYDVIVVDNGSTDGTARVASAAGARVVAEPRRGYGWACLAGATAASGQVLVFMDADGTFEAAEIPALVGPILDGQADLVLGSRVLAQGHNEAVLPHQRFGNWLAVTLLRSCCGAQVTDLGPFRAIRREVLLGMQMSERTYGWPTEMMVKAVRMGCRTVEVPVTSRPRVAGRSKVSGTVKGSILAGYHIIRVIARLGFRSFLEGAAGQESEACGEPR
jgi:glycosyltransferase involved in cell wall biosynthesis